MKKYWNWYTDNFGLTVFHPQFVILTYVHEGIQKALKEAEGASILDVGCGRMPYRELFLPLAKKYVGLDHPKVSKLYKGVQKPDVFADITKKTPLSDRSFDLVLMFEVLEYLEDPQAALKEVRRLLETRGKLVLTSPFLYPLHDVGFDRNRFTDVQIKTLIQEAGLNLVELEAKGSFWEFWFLSLNVYIFRKIMDSKLVFLIIPGLFIVIFTNTIICMLKILGSKKKGYFPVSYLVVATRR